MKNLSKKKLAALVVLFVLLRKPLMTAWDVLKHDCSLKIENGKIILKDFLEFYTVKIQKERENDRKAAFKSAADERFRRG